MGVVATAAKVVPLYQISHSLVCIHCLLASARNIWINSVVCSRKREITCIAFVIDLSNIASFRLTSL